jgi:hypothetical protein
MIEPEKIERIAQMEVMNSLREVGWQMPPESQPQDLPKVIAANANGKRILVQVRTSVAPDKPPDLTDPYLERLMTRGRMEHSECYQARLQLSSDLKMIGRIEWKRVY